MPQHGKTSEKSLCGKNSQKNQTDLDERCISLVVQNLDPGNGAKLLKSVEEGIRVGQVGRDVGHHEYNLSYKNANQQPHVTYTRALEAC